MKSSFPKNIKQTLDAPKFKVGDLVRHRCYDLDLKLPAFGIVLEINIVADTSIDFPYIMNHYHQYKIRWLGEPHPTNIYEMFIEPYAPKQQDAN